MLMNRIDRIDSYLNVTVRKSSAASLIHITCVGRQSIWHQLSLIIENTFLPVLSSVSVLSMVY